MNLLVPMNQNILTNTNKKDRMYILNNQISLMSLISLIH